MSLFRPDVRLAVLRLRNERLLQSETNVPLSSIMANRQYSRPDGDALNDRETDFSYEEEDKFETQVGDDVREYAKQEKRQERENKQAENEIIADAEEEKRAEERIEEMALGSKKGGAMKRCVGSGEPASLGSVEPVSLAPPSVAPASVGGRAVQKAKSKATQEAEEVEKLKKKKRKSKRDQEKIATHGGSKASDMVATIMVNNPKKFDPRKVSNPSQYIKDMIIQTESEARRADIRKRVRKHRAGVKAKKEEMIDMLLNERPDFEAWVSQKALGKNPSEEKVEKVYKEAYKKQKKAYQVFVNKYFKTLKGMSDEQIVSALDKYLEDKTAPTAPAEGETQGGAKKRKLGDKMKRRMALVKKLMAEKGMKLGEASKYIKANNLSY